MRFLDGLIPRGATGRGILTLAGGTVAAQVIVACAMPIVTRLYSPGEIGIITMFLAFFGFWSTVLSWRYESAVFVAGDDTEAQLVVQLGIVLVLLMSILSGLVLAVLVMTRSFGFGVIPLWGAAAAVPIHLGFGLFMMYRAWGLRAGLVRDIGVSTVSKAASNALVRVVLGLVGFGVPGLFGAELAGAWAATGAIRRAVRKRLVVHRMRWRISEIKSVARRYMKFPKYEAPSVALDQLAVIAPVPILTSLFGPEAAGWYGLARMLVALPNAQIGRAVGDVFQMEFSSAIREGDRVAARRLFNRLLRGLALVGLAPLLVVIVGAPPLMPWVFGGAWKQAGLIAACIAPWLYGALVVGSLGRLVSVLERQEYKLIYDLTTLMMVFGVYGASRHWGLALVPTVLLLTCANLIGYGIYLGILMRLVSLDLDGEVA